MKNYKTICMQVVLAIVVFLILSGCTKSRNHINPFDPANPAATTPTPTPTPYLQIVWKNGISGTFCSETVVATNGASCALVSTVSATNNINGDTQALNLYGYTSCGQGVLLLDWGLSPYVYVGNYVPNGTLQFDIMLGQPPSVFSSITVYLYDTAGTVPLNPNSLSTSQFTHVSVPISSLMLGGAETQSAFGLEYIPNTPFTGTACLVDDIQWVP